MKIIIAACLLVISGCATQQRQPSPQMLELERYVASQKPRAEKGDLRWSDYYDGLYSRQISANYPPQLVVIANKLKRVSQQYEHGEISQEDFQFGQRDLRAQAQIIGQQLQAEQQTREAARRQANMALAAQILQSSTYTPTAQYSPIAPTTVQPASTMPLQPFRPINSGVTAYWTGQQRQVQTVTYQSGWSCEYRYAAQTFWRTFIGTCPNTIQVQ